LYAARSFVAVIAAITLVSVGIAWKIKDRTDSAFAARAVVALNSTDPNLSAARTAPKVMTNSNGEKTTQAAKPVADYPAEDILLMGSDTRVGAGNAAVGADASTTSASESDTLMIAHVSGDRQHVTVLSIPRDTLIPPPSCKAWNSAANTYSDNNFPLEGVTHFHINNAFAIGGPRCTVQVVQRLTGIKITRLLGIDFSGFEAMVNALGGITVNLCHPVIDTLIQTVIPTAGVQTIQGFQALNLVRARHVIGDTESDLARIRRQQAVLSAILRQVTQAGTLLNPVKLDSFLQAFATNTFNENIKVDDLVTLAGSLGSLDPGRVNFYTMPTVVSQTVEGLNVDDSKAPAIFDDLINDLPLPGEFTAAPKASPTLVAPSAGSTAAPPAAPSAASGPTLTRAPADISLEVYNVSGLSNVATNAQAKLNAIGFKVTDDQLFKPDTDSQIGTTVLFSEANRAAALTVVAAVPGSTLVLTPGLGATVRLRLGSSFTGSISPVVVGAAAPAALVIASTSSSAATAASTSSAPPLPSVNAGTNGCF